VIGKGAGVTDSVVWAGACVPEESKVRGEVVSK